MLGLLTPTSLIDSFLAGLICGLIPLYFSTGKDRLKLGFGGLLACVASGLLLGLALAIPVGRCVSLADLSPGLRPVPFQVQARNRRLVITVMSVLGTVRRRVI